MKILHVITGLPNGGGEAVLTNLVETDRTNQHVVVSLQDEGYFGSRIRKSGVNLHCIGMQKGRFSLSGFLSLRRLIKKESPDCVQTWLYHGDLVGGLAAKFAGCRQIVWGIHHTTLEPGKTGLSIRLIVKLLALLSYVVPNKIICCSNASQRVHAAAGYSKRKLRVTYNGYDVSTYTKSADSRTAVRSALALETDDLVFGMVGRWNPQKDHANLVKALSIFTKNSTRRWFCLLAGGGLDEDNAEIVSMISSHNLEIHVKLLGIRDDIPAIMNAIDIHVLSSAFGEAFPNVVSEAMSCGTPCVVTDVGDAAFIVDETGWVVPPSDPPSLASALKNAADTMTDQAAWQNRSDACRTRIQENFTLQQMITAYQTVWAENN